MPIYNWWKINSTGDLSFVLVKQKKLNATQKKVLDKYWKMIFDDYISIFGFSEDFIEIIEQKKTDCDVET